MAEVITVQDLETLKKHEIFEAEVITGKVGGVAGGADIQTATNAVTLQVQKTLPQVLKDLGFKPAAFTFETGGTLAAGDHDLAVYNPAPNGDNNWYSWGGALPKVIPAASTPETTGGFGDAAWTPRTDETLAYMLGAAGGVSLVGNSDAYCRTLSEVTAQTWLEEGMIISTGGYAAVNDGGSGRYHITSSGPAADGLIDKTIGTGPLKAVLMHNGEIKPQQAGAVPGASDASAAMQAIINAGVAVAGDKNSYTIVNSLLLKNDSVIRGKNKGAFKLVQGSTQPIIKLDSTAGSLQNCTVENVDFIPNGFIGPAIEFVGTNPNDWHIFKNLKIKGALNAGFHRSIKCTGRMIWCAFENVEIMGDRDDGVYVVSAGSVNLNSFTNVRSALCQGHGFHFESTTGNYFKVLNFITCNSEANGKDLARVDVAGFYFSNVGETVLNGCYIEDNGVGLADSSALRVTGTFGGVSVVGGLYWGSAYGINNTANLSWGSYEGYRASGTVVPVHVKNLNSDSRVRLGVGYGDMAHIEKDVNSDTRVISSFVNGQSISAESSAITSIRGKSFLHYLNGSAVSLTAASFADGVLGQRVLIMGSGAALTIVHSSGLVLKTGADIVLNGGKSIEIIKISDTVWVQIT